jgi:hypothetical protein
LSESHLLGFNHIYVALSLHSIRHNYLHNYDVFSIYYKNYHTGRRNVLAFDFDDLFVVDFDEFQFPLRRISTSTSTNLYSTSQLRRIWIETDIWTYENDICVMEMICTCS